MNNPITFTPSELWGWILALCAAIITIAGALTIIFKIVKAAKKPNDDQNDRLDTLEQKVDEHDRLFKQDNNRFKYIEEGSRVTQRALLALLDHGLDGNNLDQMRKAKEDLQQHLIEK